ncbi:MAG: hypothetical protein IKM48_05410 [Clostridia bacterium]|nr:hypothetical protein [Clostridia bacterium]
MAKRVHIFAGHYGSGKTNLAVNFALKLKEEGLPVKIADLDIVNPYFRTKDSARELEEAGIPLISPAFANTNVDLPALPAELYSLVQRQDCYAVMDVGGDDRGAYALGRYAPYIVEENNYEMYFVVNFYRPLTPTPEDAFVIMREIEEAAHIKCTGIINNSNLGESTTPEAVRETVEKADALSALCGLPVVYTSATAEICRSLEGETFPMTLQEKYY